MTRPWRKLAKDDDGAVTVDWVVITAAVIGLGVLVFDQVGGSVSSVSTNVRDFFLTAKVAEINLN
jgi:Flp pilus assembly pilin Flp